MGHNKTVTQFSEKFTSLNIYSLHLSKQGTDKRTLILEKKISETIYLHAFDDREPNIRKSS